MSVLRSIFLVSHSKCEVYVFLLLESWEMSVSETPLPKKLGNTKEADIGRGVFN